MRMNKKAASGIQSAVCFFSAISLAGCCTCTAPDKHDLVIEELKSIRSSLELITEKLSEQEANREKVRSFSSRFGSPSDRGVNIEKLADITLPDHPSPEEVKTYIQEIMSASEGQRGVSRRDPQIALYAEVGSENLPLLIESLSHGSGRGMNGFHIRYAIMDLADEQHKPLILDSLPKSHSLVEVVLEKGWEKDARDILLAEFRTEQQLPTKWIEATALLNDPESYPLLREYFIKGDRRSSTYNAIRNLPIEDMPGAVANAWKESRYEHEYEQQRMAMIALEFGHIDALELLVDALISPSDSTSSSFMKKQMRFAVLKATGFIGSNEELAKWLATNKERLQFDMETKKFVIKKESEQKTVPKKPDPARETPAD